MRFYRFYNEKGSLQWVLTCLLRLEFQENVASQISQWKGFFPVCVDMSVFRCEFQEKVAPQISKCNVFSQFEFLLYLPNADL